MDCEQARNLFDTYLDGELTGSLAAEFGAHKLNCSACRRELALLEVAGHVIAADTDTPLLSEEFSERLLACAMSAQRPWYRRKRSILYVGGPLAAAACVALLVSAFYHAPGAAAGGHRPPAPMVLDEVDRVETPAELLENVEHALTRNPDNLELQRAADALRSRVREIADGTKDGASVLENSLKETIMEILERIPIDSPRNEEEPSPATESSGDDHDPPVEDL